MRPRQRTAIILSYGTYLGWLLAFPYSGPVLAELAEHRGYSPAVLGLIYTAIPVVFLAFLLFVSKKDAYARHFMLVGSAASLFGSALVYFLDNPSAYLVMGIMGISSVTFIVGWSKFYGENIGLPDKMPVMALVILTGNIIHYCVVLIIESLPFEVAFLAALLPLAATLYFSMHIADSPATEYATMQSRDFPRTLMAVVCGFIFVLNFSGGLMFQAIEPFLRLQGPVIKYYSLLPYIVTVMLYYRLGRRFPRFLPVYLATSILGLAFLAFAFAGSTLSGGFLIETLAQSGWAMIDVFLWSLMGEIATLYGRPMTICALALASNLGAVFLGGLAGVKLVGPISQQAVLTSGLLAASMVFVTFLIVPFMSSRIENDLVERSRSSRDTPALEVSALPLEQEMKGKNLTNRQIEIVTLMLQGRGNREIAELLRISENTLKVHARSIYAKMGVANKRELMHLALTAKVDK